MNNFHVPREWEHVVCICPEDHGEKTLPGIPTMTEPEPQNPPEHSYSICRSCEKLKRYYTSHCRKCGNFYLMVFSHPVWSPSVNYCFDCCLGVKNYASPTAPSIRPPLDKFRYPAKLKTTEELAAELDDLFSSW